MIVGALLAATLIVWGSQFFLFGTVITWTGAIGAGILLGLSEIPLHRWIQASRREGARGNR